MPAPNALEIKRWEATGFHLSIFKHPVWHSSWHMVIFLLSEYYHPKGTVESRKEPTQPSHRDRWEQVLTIL